MCSLLRACVGSPRGPRALCRARGEYVHLHDLQEARLPAFTWKAQGTEPAWAGKSGHGRELSLTSQGQSAAGGCTFKPERSPSHVTRVWGCRCQQGSSHWPPCSYGKGSSQPRSELRRGRELVCDCGGARCLVRRGMNEGCDTS